MASLQDRLESLRAKPEHIRKRYAFFGAFGITAVIFAFWIGSFTSYRLIPGNAVTAAMQKAKSPASSLVASVGSFFTDLKDLVFGPSKVTYSSVEVLPGK